MAEEVWVEVRRHGRLLFRYDPNGNRVAIMGRGRKVPDVIALSEIQPRPTSRPTPKNAPRRDDSGE